MDHDFQKVEVLDRSILSNDIDSTRTGALADGKPACGRLFGNWQRSARGCSTRGTFSHAGIDRLNAVALVRGKLLKAQLDRETLGVMSRVQQWPAFLTDLFRHRRHKVFR
jgi:hypothetical protein